MRGTVILSHGGGQTRMSWSGAVSALIGAGFRVINFDTRGHGESGWAGRNEYGLPYRAQDLVAIAEHAEGPIALVGASMGGNTALYTVLTTDIRADALVLVDIVPKPDLVGVQRVRDFMTRHLDGFDTLDEVVEAVAAYNPLRPKPPDPSGLMKNLRARDGKLFWHWDPAITEITFEHEHGMLCEAILENRARPALPVLLVHGRQSDVVSADGITQLLEIFPDAEVLDVAGAGHMVAGDRNDAFNAGIIQFLARNFPMRAR